MTTVNHRTVSDLGTTGARLLADTAYWSWMLREVLLPSGDLLFGQRMIKRLRFLEQAQWWNRERLYAARDQLLRSTIDIAYREVPFYRNLMQNAGIEPADVRTVHDLRKLPVVTKQMLSNGYPEQTVRKTGWRSYEECTSGSTGTNLRVRTDTETEGWYRASLLLALEWAGWKIGERHLQTGMTTRRGIMRTLKDALLGCYYVSAYELSDVCLDRMLEILERKRVSHVWGYPGSVYFLARRARQTGWTTPLRSVVTWGDMLYQHYRREIQAVFKTRVFDTYGCAEGMQIAAQCGRGEDYHIHALDVVVECVDENDNSVGCNETGNLVLTRLHPGPMPLIRYRVGDVGRLANDRVCACGRGFDLLETIEGRDTDVITSPAGNRLIVHFFTGVLEHFPEITSFQVVHESLASVVLRLVPGKGFTDEVSARAVSMLKSKGAFDLDFRVEVVDEITLPSSGKRRFIISQLAGQGQSNRGDAGRTDDAAAPANNL